MKMKMHNYHCLECNTESYDQEVPPKCPKCKKLMWKNFSGKAIHYKAKDFTGAQKGKAGRDGN